MVAKRILYFGVAGLLLSLMLVGINLIQRVKTQHRELTRHYTLLSSEIKALNDLSANFIYFGKKMITPPNELLTQIARLRLELNTIAPWQNTKSINIQVSHTCDKLVEETQKLIELIKPTPMLEIQLDDDPNQLMAIFNQWHIRKASYVQYKQTFMPLYESQQDTLRKTLYKAFLH